MSDVLFVVPTFKKDIAEEIYGTLILATILRKNNIDTDIYRFFEADTSKGFNSFIKETATNILSKNPKVVSFYCRCDCYLADIMIAKEIKSISSDTYIVFGGPQADACAYDTINEIPWVDFCCIGEGETTVYPLFSALLCGKDFSDIRGLVYRNNNGIVQNPRPELIKNLDEIESIDYSLIPSESLDKAIKNKEYFAIDVGRGCPFNCAYCSTSLFWERKFRLKSTECIIEEMEYLNKKFGTTKFGFKHDLFTASKKRVLEFTDACKVKGLDYRWYCSSRVDTIDEKSIKAMAECGLDFIYLGIESGSERMQKLIDKNLKIEDVLKVAKCLKDNNIDIIASFMYGFPEETEDDVELTLQLIYKLFVMGVETFQYHLCTIMPGTKYYKEYFDRLTPASSHSDMVSDFGTEECADFIKEHLKVFPYFYEYVNEHRTKFLRLNTFANVCIYLYAMFRKLLPDESENMRIVDIFFNLDMLYKNTQAPKDRIRMMQDYIKKYYDKETADKLLEVLRFLNEQNSIAKDFDFTADVKVFSVDINALLNGKKLCEISKCQTMVYFNRIGNEIKTTAVNMSALS